MNNKLEKLIHKTAKRIGEDEALVMEVVDHLFRTAASAMKDYRYPEVRIPNLGVFRPRIPLIESEIEKLLLKLKVHGNPNSLYGKIVTLNKTAKRVRHERIKRKRKRSY